ncbi:MAG TPA: hypothetical protein VEW48_12440 [Thermoanaerobaculia bacterium]|nr:hypothetical protein [Thermoanaerobaculia bacterium]
MEQGVSGALDDEAIRSGVREGVNVQSGVNPNTAVPGDGTPLTSASREYGKTLHRILSGTFFEPAVPGEGC